jgi:hypothetical protein
MLNLLLSYGWSAAPVPGGGSDDRRSSPGRVSSHGTRPAPARRCGADLAPARRGGLDTARGVERGYCRSRAEGQPDRPVSTKHGLRCSVRPVRAAGRRPGPRRPQVRITFQPGWPLRAALAYVTIPHSTDRAELYGPDETAPGQGNDGTFLWLATGDLPDGENPYAPGWAWLGSYFT